MDNLMRDGNDLAILQPLTVTSAAELEAGGIWLPSADRKLDKDFMLTQIIVVSNFQFYWELITNVDVDAMPPVPKDGWSRKIYGSALPGVHVSLPLTIRARCRKDSSIWFRYDVDGIGAPPAGTSGSAIIELHGYFIQADKEIK